MMTLDEMISRPQAEPQTNDDDRAAVTILRRLYEQVDGRGSDALYDARQYLADRERYLQNRVRYGV